MEKSNTGRDAIYGVWSVRNGAGIGVGGSAFLFILIVIVFVILNVLETGN